MRLYELAKDLGLQPKDLVAKVRAMAIDVANHMSQIEPADADRIRRAVDRERHESLVEERLTVDGTVIRRRSKVVAAAPAPARQVVSAAPAPAPVAAPAAPAPQPVAPPPARPRARAGRRRQASRVDTDPRPQAPAPAPTPPVEVCAAGAGRGAGAAAARPRSGAGRPAPAPAVSTKPVEMPVPQPLSRAGLKTIPQPVVTGSAATGAFIQLPGLAPRGGDANAPRVEIKDRDEELRRLGRSNLLNRAPAGRDRFGRPSFGPGGQRPGSFPKKRVAAAGKKLKQTQITTPAEHKRVVRMDDTIAVAELAKKMAVQGREIVKKLWALGMMGVTINQDIDLDTATLIANEFGFQIESTAFNEDEVLTDTETPDNPEDVVPRAPVVTIMGHVDHGKTSLLDAIRKANVAAGEAGGITQHIGAYKVAGEKGEVVFLDTPGHEAFTAMRARGAQMTDIVVLVVAADDGPMPQTIEAINHAKEAQVPIVVAINKIDKPGANPDLIRNKLSEHQLVSEEWGGTTIFVNVSAKTKEGIDKLLEMLALQAELLELKANPNKQAKGHVIEARLDRARGPISTILVEDGTLKLGDLVVAGEYSGKIRAMLGDKGQALTEAGPSTPVEVLGLDGVPDAGEVFNVVTDEKAVKTLVEHRHDARRKKELASGSAPAG